MTFVIATMPPIFLGEDVENFRLRLQHIHLPDKLLKQLAAFRPDALLQLVHDLIRRQRATETGSIGASLPTNDFRHRHHATKERLRIFLG
jgi:hypothetical protein